MPVSFQSSDNYPNVSERRCYVIRKYIIYIETILDNEKKKKSRMSPIFPVYYKKFNLI